MMDKHSCDYVHMDVVSVVEYHVVISILTEASTVGISHMIVHLDSQLMVSQLNHIYTFHNPTLLHLYLRVCLLD